MILRPKIFRITVLKDVSTKYSLKLITSPFLIIKDTRKSLPAPPHTQNLPIRTSGSLKLVSANNSKMTDTVKIRLT